MDNIKVELDQLMPQDTELKIGDKVYGLRKLNLEDEAWLKANFRNAAQLIKNEDVDFMAKVTFRLLKDKRDFVASEIDDYDEDGLPIKRLQTGPQKILAAMSGAGTRYDWLRTLCETFGISRPLFDKMVEESLKKNGIATETIQEKGEQLTGEKSSTLSPQSTASGA